MWFLLARTLGMSVRRCQEEVDSAEFTEWQALYDIDPWGEERADLRNSVACWTSATAAGAKGLKPDSFLLRFDQDPTPDTPVEEKLKAIFPRLAGG